MSAVDALESKAEAPRPEFRPSRRWALALVAALLSWLVILTIVDETEPRDGVQGRSPALTLRSANETGWVALESDGVTDRQGFPEPMVWRGDVLCIGFGREDFAFGERRPTLARCVPGDVAAELPANGIVATMSVIAGFDTWQFIEAAGDVRDVDVRLADGSSLDEGRIFVAGSTVGLRFENRRDVAEVRWSIRTGDIRCAPAADVWATGRFCPTSTGGVSSLDGSNGG